MSDTVSAQATLVGGAVTVSNGAVHVHDVAALASSKLDVLVHQAVFAATDVERDFARWVIWEIGQNVGVRPASIHELYVALSLIHI